MYRSALVRCIVAIAFLIACALLVSAPGPEWTTSDKAYYLDAQQLNFIRPGLVIKITGAAIGNDNVLRVRFKLTDPKGLPLDRDGITSPGAISVSFIAAYIPKGKTQYAAYTTRAQTSPITKVTAMQAGTDSGGTFEKLEEGAYQYTFKTAIPASYDKTVTHTVGAYGSRNLSEFDMPTNYSNDVFHFVPDGSKVTYVRDVVKSETCNKCHHQLAFHGGSRRTMEVCVLCHQPQTIDPDTGNSVDMVPMIHKIHMGAGLPSVKGGQPYQIIGHNQTVADYSKINFPADARRCTTCHESGAAQADAWLKPNRVACGACHDNVNFATGEGHVDLPQVSDNQCASCHVPKGELEFDASIMGAHTIPRHSANLPGVVFEILKVDDGVAGKRPTVTFSIKDKSGNPIKPSDMQRLSLILAGPNTDYASYVSEAALTAGGTADGRYFWTFQQPIPADAKGSYTIELEGRREVKLMAGTRQEITQRDAGGNKVLTFSVDGSKPEPRRTVVAISRCNSCHGSLSFHGDNRNAIEACVICHSPTRTGGPQSSLPIDFKVMIHKIHTGHELTVPYAFSATNNFNEIGYPGDRRKCDACHVNGSELLPLKGPGRLAVADPSGAINPMSPITAACTGCHTERHTAAHALTNTSEIGEACANCHGGNADFAVQKMHAR